MVDAADQDIRRLRDAAALQGLTIEADWTEAVLAHWRATAAAARLVLDFPLDDHVEPASVFVPH